MRKFVLTRTSGTSSAELPTPGAVWDRDGWVIDLDVAGLLELVAREGPVIVRPNAPGELPVLEIYDDYRE